MDKPIEAEVARHLDDLAGKVQDLRVALGALSADNHALISEASEVRRTLKEVQAERWPYGLTHR